MPILGWVVIGVLSVLIMGPLFHIGLFRVDETYSRFRYVSWVLLLWNVISFLRYLVTDVNELYYLSMAIYPTVFLLVLVLLFAMYRYLGYRIPTWMTIFLWGFFLLDVVVSFTNASHQWMLHITPTAGVTFQSFQAAPEGVFFHVHTAVSYLILIVMFARLVERLLDNWQMEKDYVPMLLVSGGIVIGITVNLIHVFAYSFTIDPTFLTFVVVISVLYYTFYMRDIRLILLSGRNRFLLEHLKEEYVLVDQSGYVVSTSPDFLKTHGIEQDEVTLTYEELRASLASEAVLFGSSDELDTRAFSLDKSYWIERKKEIRLPFLKTPGSLYLYYDDTANQRFIHGIQYVKNHDLVTGLYNRNHLEEIRDELDDAYDHYHLILFDLDGLKLFNDYHGHPAGDAFLQRFAQRLKEWEAAYGGISIRLGGDEFLWILLDEEPNKITTIVEDITHAYDDVDILEEVRFSFGVATNYQSDMVLSQVFSLADKIMYQSKHSQDDYKGRLERALKETVSKRDKDPLR